MSARPLPPGPAGRRGEPAAGRHALADERGPTAERGLAADPERAMRTCPNCGRELTERGCKLRCPDPACGYFLSCAEYY